jgi:hypothetical protein
MNVCDLNLIATTAQVAGLGLGLALIVTGLYIVMVRWVHYREHNNRRKAWRDRERG